MRGERTRATMSQVAPSAQSALGHCVESRMGRRASFLALAHRRNTLSPRKRGISVGRAYSCSAQQVIDGPEIVQRSNANSNARPPIQERSAHVASSCAVALTKSGRELTHGF